jgi:hypothetical protein
LHRQKEKENAFMRTIALMLVALWAAPASAQEGGAPAPATPAAAKSIYEVKVETMKEAAVTTVTGNTLAPYKGKVMLIVNVASYCGNTPQYTGLEAMNQKYHVSALRQGQRAGEARAGPVTDLPIPARQRSGGGLQGARAVELREVACRARRQGCGALHAPDAAR